MAFVSLFGVGRKVSECPEVQMEGGFLPILSVRINVFEIVLQTLLDIKNLQSL